MSRPSIPPVPAEFVRSTRRTAYLHRLALRARVLRAAAIVAAGVAAGACTALPTEAVHTPRASAHFNADSARMAADTASRSGGGYIDPNA